MFMDRESRHLQPGFVSRCVFRVQSSRGEADYGSPVYFGNLIQLELVQSGQLYRPEGISLGQHRHHLTFEYNLLPLHPPPKKNTDRTTKASSCM